MHPTIGCLTLVEAPNANLTLRLSVDNHSHFPNVLLVVRFLCPIKLRIPGNYPQVYTNISLLDTLALAAETVR